MFVEFYYVYSLGENEYLEGWNSSLIYDFYKNSINICPGIQYNINSNFGLQLSVNFLEYTKTKEKPKYFYNNPEKAVDEYFGLSSISDNIRFGILIFI